MLHILTVYIDMESSDVFVLNLFKFMSDLPHSAAALVVFKGPSPPTMCLSVEMSYFVYVFSFLTHMNKF